MNDNLCRILIVDDAPEDRETYRRSLDPRREKGYAFFEASTGGEGLALWRKEKPDCILLDYSLPDLNGLEFLEELRRQDAESDVPVIMLTGQGNEAVAVEALKKGAQDYLVKKLAGDNLADIIRGAIDRVALMRQLEERRKEVQSLAEQRTLLIEQLRQQAVELKEADRRKDEFLAILAHELRNPLGPIRNATRILGFPPTSECSHAQAREIIERQVAHMGRLIDDLLDVSRIVRGKVRLQRERVDLRALTLATAEDHRSSIEMAGLKLTIEVPEASAWVNGDSTRLSQVISNLLHNAVKFTDPGGVVALSLQCAQDRYVVTVSDTGIGMDAAVLARAFETFTQADRSLDRSRGGLGLGLALSKGLVELHGGQIEAHSDGIGKGSRITLTLPPDHVSAKTATVSPPADRAPSWRVLIIEDNVDAAQTLGLLLRHYGHRPLVTYSGMQGLQAAREFRPDVVLCDIGLPGDMDGFAVARAMRGDEQLRSAYLVAVTGYALDEDVQHALTAGFNLHMTKPVDPTRLQTMLGNLTLPQIPS